MDTDFSANKDLRKIKWLALFLLIMLYPFSAGIAFSIDNNDAGPANNHIGEFNILNGTASLIRDGKAVDIKEGESFELYDIAETEINSEALISLKNDSVIVVGGQPKSKLVSKEYSQTDEKEGETVFYVPYGEIRVMTCDDKFSIETPMANIDAHGNLDFEVWERQIDNSTETCVAVFKGEVYVENINKSIKGSVRVPKLMMSCVSAGGVPSEPVGIPDELLIELSSKGDRFFDEDRCTKKECGECERLNPAGVCVPDNHKLCDDGDVCTTNDRCKGRVCRGQRDPSTTNPNCS